MKEKKIINKVIERCIDCPYFRECEGELFCGNLGKQIERKDFKIIDKGFPGWCLLTDASISIKSFKDYTKKLKLKNTALEVK